MNEKEMKQLLNKKAYTNLQATNKYFKTETEVENKRYSIVTSKDLKDIWVYDEDFKEVTYKDIGKKIKEAFFNEINKL